MAVAKWQAVLPPHPLLSAEHPASRQETPAPASPRRGGRAVGPGGHGGLCEGPTGAMLFMHTLEMPKSPLVPAFW